MSYTYKFLDPSIPFKPGMTPVQRRTNGEYDRTIERKLGHGIKFNCVVFKNRRSEVEIPMFDLTAKSVTKLDKKHPGWREITKKEKKEEEPMKKLT